MDGYLPCIGVKEGWFNGESYYRWIVDELLPNYNLFPGPRSVIVMDNVAIHTNPRIEEAIRQHGSEIRYLPPYSPDFKPIELYFSVLKAWIRRHFHQIWPHFEGSFGDFLRYAVRRIRCDQHAKGHFNHSNCYIYEADLRELERKLEACELDFDQDI